MGLVKFTGTSDFSKIERDYQKLQREVAKTKEENAKLVKQADDGSKKQKSGSDLVRGAVQGVTSALTSHALGIINVGRVWQAAEKNVQAYIAAASEASKQQIKVGGAQAEFVQSLGDVGAARTAEIITQFKGIGGAAGFPEDTDFFRAAAGVQGVTGDVDASAAILTQLAPLYRTRSAQLAPNAEAIGELVNVSGARTEADIARVVALALQTQQSKGLQGDDLSNVARALAGATGGRQVSFDALEKSAAAFGALATSLGSPRTAKSVFAAVSERLEELLPGQDIQAQVQAVQGDRFLKERLFEGDEDFQKLTVSVEARRAVEALFDPSSRIAQDFAARAAVPTDVTAIDRLLESLSTASNELRGATEGAKIGQFTEGAILGRTSASTISRIREIDAEVVKSQKIAEPGFSTLQGVLPDVLTRLSVYGTPEDIAGEALGRAAARLGATAGFGEILPVLQGGNVSQQTLSELTAAEREAVTTYVEAIRSLQGIIVELRSPATPAAQAPREVGSGRER